jgi:hypothetical protein
LRICGSKWEKEGRVKSYVVTRIERGTICASEKALLLTGLRIPEMKGK